MDIILLFFTKPLDKHGTTLVHITYPPLHAYTQKLKENFEEERPKAKPVLSQNSVWCVFYQLQFTVKESCTEQQNMHALETLDFV